METDLAKIKQIAEEKEDENWAFRNFLKRYDVPIEKLDGMVHQLYRYVASRLDCTACANCCRCFSPILEKEDIQRLSAHMGLSIPQFIERFLSQNSGDDVYLVKNQPCPFLKGNLCSQYDLRPEGCVSFPHLDKDDFIFRLTNVVNNYAVCPIVYNVFEMLKSEIWHE